MSKKHFIALADSLKDFFATNAGKEMGDISQGVLLHHLEWFCARQNENFNAQRWYDYIAGKCGPNGGKL